MRHILIVTFFFIIFGCENSKKTEIALEEIAFKSFETKIDSISLDTDPIYVESLLDSLLKIDSTNKVALETKATNHFNDGKFSTALSFINKLKNQKDSLQPSLYIISGWSYERLHNTELSEQELSIALSKLSETNDQMWIRPALITVVFGKDSAEKWTENKGGDLSELSLYQTRNTLKNYRNGGLSEFYPKFFDYPSENEFTVDVSDPNYNFESAGEVELYFAKKGLNAYFKGTNKANDKIFIVAENMYAEEIEKLDPQNIKRR